MIRKVLTFPPVSVFLAIVICGFIVNVVANFYSEDDNMQKMYLLNPVAVLSSKEIEKPGRVSVMVTTGVEGDYTGWLATVYVYGPDGRLYDVRDGIIDNTGSATVDIWFGVLSAAGNYTVLPAVGYDSNHLVIGKPVFLVVKRR